MLGRLRFAVKLQLLGVVIVALGAIGTVVLARVAERRIYEGRFSQTKHVVEVAWGIADHYAKEAEKGTVSTADAQALALGALRELRYEGNEYFWVNDLEPRILMHPMKPELEGRNVADMRDPSGLAIFVAFADTVRQRGAGLVRYEWPKPGSDRPVDKVSYVKGIPRWGWVIGSGIYLDDVRAAVTQQRRAILLGTVLVMVMCLALSYSLARILTRDLLLVREGAQQAAGGDLSVRVNVGSRDELGDVAVALNDMLTQFGAAMAEVQSAARHAASSAAQLAEGSQHLSDGAQESASSLEETASSLEEITSTVKQNADNAQQASQLATGARDVAESGGRVVSQAVAAMEEINRSSQQIADIITTIDEIAFQTNLLALNAAVEAARAGEQGRGFAVVAAEVRNLAQRSAGAAREIKTLIQDSVRKVEAGAGLVNESGRTLQEIVTSVKRVTDVVQEIAAASREQSVGIDQVNGAVTQMDQVTQANASQTEELSATAESLHQQARLLQAAVERFRLADQASSPVGLAPVAPVPAPAHRHPVAVGE